MPFLAISVPMVKHFLLARENNYVLSSNGTLMLLEIFLSNNLNIRLLFPVHPHPLPKIHLFILQIVIKLLLY